MKIPKCKKIAEIQENSRSRESLTVHCSCVKKRSNSGVELCLRLYEDSHFKNNGNHHPENFTSVSSRWDEFSTNPERYFICGVEICPCIYIIEN